MNFFYDLPDEIQEKIYFEAHKLNSKDLFKQIKKIDFWKHRVDYQLPGDTYVDLEMLKLLYSLGATQEELGEYYYARDWTDGRKERKKEHLFENKYLKVWYDYWVERVPDYFR